MNRIITFLASILTFIGFASLLQPQPKQKAPGNNSLLWRISGKNLSKPSYLFGTMHLICKDDYVWTEKMKQSLSESEKVCFEMDMDDPAVLMQVATGLIDTTGKKLEDYFTPAQYKLVKQYVKDSAGMDISIFQQMKPVALQTMITVSGAMCADPLSYEDSLMKTAKHDKKEILGLEAPAEQIAVLESIPVDTIISDLMSMIQETHRDDSEYLKMITAYKAQDISALYKLITTSKELGDMGIFLDGRNKKWIARMAGQMEHSSVFFAVGAGHLWGNNGVIELLKKQGYSVTAIL